VSIEPAPENQASGLPMIVVCEGGNYDMGTDKLSRNDLGTRPRWLWHPLLYGGMDFERIRDAHQDFRAPE
jgi:hypothetical protein